MNNNTDEFVHDNDDKSFDGINKFAKQVFDTLKRENTQITPVAFTHMYERLLEDKPLGFKKELTAILDGEGEQTDDTLYKMEKNMKDGFVSIRSVMQTLSGLYKNINLMGQISKQKVEKIKSADKPIYAQEAVEEFERELVKLTNVLSKNSTDIKNEYAKVQDILQAVKADSKFDNQFEVYSRKHLDDLMKKELKDAAKFKYKSSILFVKIKDEVKNALRDPREKLLMDKTLAKILLKRSKRSDIIAVYEDGIFAIILKRTGIKNSQIAAERIITTMELSAFYSADQEVEIKIDIGLANIATDRLVMSTYDLAKKVMLDPTRLITQDDEVGIG